MDVVEFSKPVIVGVGRHLPLPSLFYQMPLTYLLQSCHPYHRCCVLHHHGCELLIAVLFDQIYVFTNHGCDYCGLFVTIDVLALLPLLVV